MTNAERYKTAKEREEAFDLFCAKNYKSDLENCCAFCELNGCGSCKFEWLDLEAEEEKPLPCPFCGSEVEVIDFPDFADGAQMLCCVCDYQSRGCVSISEAIADHNRVAKIVMEANEMEGGAK